MSVEPKVGKPHGPVGLPGLAGRLTCLLLLPPAAQENLDQVARTVYRKMDQLYQGKMYSPGKAREAEAGTLP